MDIIFLGLTVALWLTVLGLTYGCYRLRGPEEGR
jgi:hypothetical protein